MIDNKSKCADGEDFIGDKRNYYMCGIVIQPYFDDITGLRPQMKTEEIEVPVEESIGMGNTVRRMICGICGLHKCDIDAAFMDRCLNLGMNVIIVAMVDEDFARARDIEGRAKAAGLTSSQYIDQKLDLAIDYMKRYGERVWLEVIGEHDCRWWPNINFRDRREAYEWFEKFIKRTREVKKDLQDLVLVHPRFCTYPTIFELLERRGLDLKDLNMAAHPGQEFDIHYLHKWGFKLVCLERNVGLGNVQVGISFLRGSAAQHEGYWGLSFASWISSSGVESITLYDQKMRLIGGNTVSYILKVWLAGYLSGANLVMQDNSNITHFVHQRNFF